MIIKFQHEISDNIPEEMQLQLAKQLIVENVGRQVEVFDPRIEEGDRCILVTLPIVSYENTTASTVKCLSDILTEVIADLRKGGPLSGEGGEL